MMSSQDRPPGISSSASGANRSSTGSNDSGSTPSFEAQTSFFLSTFAILADTTSRDDCDPPPVSLEASACCPTGLTVPPAR